MHAFFVFSKIGKKDCGKSCTKKLSSRVIFFCGKRVCKKKSSNRVIFFCGKCVYKKIVKSCNFMFCGNVCNGFTQHDDCLLHTFTATKKLHYYNIHNPCPAGQREADQKAAKPHPKEANSLQCNTEVGGRATAYWRRAVGLCGSFRGIRCRRIGPICIRFHWNMPATRANNFPHAPQPSTPGKYVQRFASVPLRKPSLGLGTSQRAPGTGSNLLQGGGGTHATTTFVQ